MVRHRVPADNSCLFTAIGWLADQRMDRASHYRGLAADLIITRPEKFSSAVLGKEPADYCEYINRVNTWGGALEMAVLSEALQIEIVAVDVRTGNPYRFSDGGASHSIFVLYDGVHYDALHLVEISSGRIITRIPRRDGMESQPALQAAQAIASNLRAAHQYVDISSFTLRCGDCGKAIRGQAEAVAHARETGHTGFAEYVPDLTRD
jgi:ubiquitin thioesterase OTU1